MDGSDKEKSAMIENIDIWEKYEKNWKKNKYIEIK